MPFVKIKVKRILKNEVPTPLCSVLLEKNEAGKNIFQLKKILHSVVSVEPRHKSNEIPQCKNCQSWGHTKNYCHQPPKCRKCGEGHTLSQCPSQNSGLPKCVHCKGNHEANSKECESYKKAAKFLNNRRTLNNTREIKVQDKIQIKEAVPAFPSPNLLSPPPIWPVPTTTTKQATQPQQTSSTQEEDSTGKPSLTNLLVDILQQIVKPLIPKIQSLISTLLSSLFLNEP